MESTLTNMNSSGNGGSNQSTCFEHIHALNQDLHPYETLSLLAPTNEIVWSNRTTTWLILFKIAIGVLALSYLALGITSVVLIIKKNSLRISTKTFFAVFLSMAILGFSRAALLILDPYGILGYISDSFPGWIIISRFMATLGFPSLVGSCSLIILTLCKLVNISNGKQWYEYWRYVLVLLLLPYAISIGAECLGHSHSYAALSSGLLCETLFVIWGLFVCTAYLTTGTRLLRKVKKTHRRATVLTESCYTDSESQYAQHTKKTKKIARKILAITFGTAVAGVLHSLVSAGAVTMVLLLIFSDCMGLNAHTHSTAWLVVQFANYLTELPVAALILYSITDASWLTNRLKCLCCFSSIVERQNGAVFSGIACTSVVVAGPGLRAPEEDCVAEEANSILTHSKAGANKMFTINTKKGSDSSMESVDHAMKQNSSTSAKQTRERKTPVFHTPLKAEESIENFNLMLGKALSIPDSPVLPPKQKVRRISAPLSTSYNLHTEHSRQHNLQPPSSMCTRKTSVSPPGHELRHYYSCTPHGEHPSPSPPSHSPLPTKPSSPSHSCSNV